MGLGAAATVKPRLAAADVLLALGTRLGEFTTGAYTLPAPGTRLIHIDIDPDVVGTNNATALGIVADAREAVRALHAALADAPDPHRAAREAANARDREPSAPPSRYRQITATGRTMARWTRRA